MRLLVVVEDDEVVAEPQVVAGRLLLGALVGKDQGLLDAVPAQLANLVVGEDCHGSRSLTHSKRGTGCDPRVTVSLKSCWPRAQNFTPGKSSSIEPGVNGS